MKDLKKLQPERQRYFNNIHVTFIIIIEPVQAEQLEILHSMKKMPPAMPFQLKLGKVFILATEQTRGFR